MRFNENLKKRITLMVKSTTKLKLSQKLRVTVDNEDFGGHAGMGVNNNLLIDVIISTILLGEENWSYRFRITVTTMRGCCGICIISNYSIFDNNKEEQKITSAIWKEICFSLRSVKYGKILMANVPSFSETGTMEKLGFTKICDDFNNPNSGNKLRLLEYNLKN